jgi:hypothetical protein
LPFLFVRPQAADEGWQVQSALASAMAAERAHLAPRNSRGRLAYLLCELGYQLSRRGTDRDGDLPLPRQELARTLGIGLSKVKRILALLSLSQVIRVDGERMRIIDWPRLCDLAQYDPGRLGLEPEDAALAADPAELAQNGLTAGGDQACFV